MINKILIHCSQRLIIIALEWPNISRFWDHVILLISVLPKPVVLALPWQLSKGPAELKYSCLAPRALASLGYQGTELLLAQDVRAFATSKIFQGGVSLDQILLSCVYKSHTNNGSSADSPGAGRIGPLPNRPSANRPPKKVSPWQIGPLKSWPSANRPPS